MIALEQAASYMLVYYLLGAAYTYRSNRQRDAFNFEALLIEHGVTPRRVAWAEEPSR